MNKINRLSYMQDAYEKLDKYDLSIPINNFFDGSNTLTITQIKEYLYTCAPDEVEYALDHFDDYELTLYLEARYNLKFKEIITYSAYIPRDGITKNKIKIFRGEN